MGELLLRCLIIC